MRAFSRKKEPRAQPEVNVLPAPVLVPPTSAAPAFEAPAPPEVSGATAEGPPELAADAGRTREDLPRAPQPAVSPAVPLPSQPATAAPATREAADITPVEFEEVPSSGLIACLCPGGNSAESAYVLTLCCT